MFNKRFLAVVAIAAVTVGTSQVQAASWSIPSGNNARFGWLSGMNNTGRFGNPTINVTGFLFNNTDNFKATSTVSSVTDFARVTVNSATALGGPAAPFHTITIQEWGTFDGDLANMSVQADFSAFRLAPNGGGVTGSLSLPNDSTIFNLLDKTWYTERTLTVGDLASWGVDFTSFQLTVTNTVQVNAGSPAGTFIEKHGMRIIIPEPGTCALLALAMIPLFRRRK